MKKESPVFKHLRAISMIVEDLDHTVSVYADVLGIGPWKKYEARGADACFWARNDTTVPATFRLAECILPNIKLRLIQPNEIDETMFSQFQALHGSGIHHLAFSCEEEDAAMALLANLGDKETCSLTFKNGVSLRFVKAMKTMGFYVAIEPENFSFEQLIAPVREKASHIHGVIDRIAQVCCGVDEVESHIKYCADDLGMKPWVRVRLTEDCLEDIDSGATKKSNHFDCGLYDGYAVQMEYTAPLAEGNLHDEYLKSDGVQLHHIAVLTPDARAVRNKLNALGAKTLCADYVDSTEISIFVDARNILGCFLQILQQVPGEGGRITDVSVYPPSEKQ